MQLSAPFYAVGRLVSRWHDAIVDPARRERTVLTSLLIYVLLWTAYGTIAKSSQGLHPDMTEIVAWSRDLSLGYLKHPPFAAWLVWLWFSVFPLTEWFYYLLAMLMPGIALWIVWRISADYLDVEKRIVGVALLTFVPFFNFHALKFNANTVMIPLWAATTALFLRSYETRNPVWAALAGLAAAAAMLGKYWSIVLLLGLALAALADPRRGAYFRSSAPWATIAAGLVGLSPHVVWLHANGFTPFTYAMETHPGTLVESVRSGLAYVAGAAGYVAVPVVLAALAAWPFGAALRDTLWPKAPDRRLVVLAFALPLALPLLLAVAAREQVISLWSIGSMTLLPVVLLSSPAVTLARIAVRRVVAIALAFPLIALAASPLVALVIHRQGVPNYATHYSGLARAVEQAWGETTDRPLRFLGSYNNLLYGVLFYLPGQVSPLEIVDPRVTPWIDDAEVTRAGIALVCPVEETGCVQALAERGSAGRRTEVAITRRYLGTDDRPDRFVIVTVPPRP